jgi:preprotein translocase SecE subunit
VSAFFRELLRAGIYKRSQGRITRQVTFAALAVTIALGLWRLGTMIEPSVDPIVLAKPARAICTLPNGLAEADGKIRITGNRGTATVVIRKGEDLEDLEKAVNQEQKATGAVAELPLNLEAKGKRSEKKLVISSEKTGAENFVSVEAPPDLLRVAGTNPDGKAYGCDRLNLGLHFLIPVVLLAIALWVCYRLVNLPVFADFLIAVEAEMNKVSWPTRPELFRASAVVLIVIFLMMFYLLVCDQIWGGLMRQLLFRGS